MKTPLGTEVDLGLGYIVLDEDVPAPAKGAQHPPLFAPCLLWPRSSISATAELLWKNTFNVKYLENCDRYDDGVIGSRIVNRPWSIDWQHNL